MNVLVLNCGSATVKFQVFTAQPGKRPRRCIRGAVQPLDVGAQFHAQVESGAAVAEPVAAPSHSAAVQTILNRLNASPLREALGNGGAAQRIDAVGHRVVHGGTAYTAPAAVDDRLLAQLHALEALAPLHNGPSIAGIRAARLALNVPMVAVFDTAFHHTLPEAHWRYPIPWDLAELHGIRRFGFHGTSYRYVLRRWCEHTGTPPDQANVVALHLGNGASAAAIRAGRSIDTTMGLTPLEGLMMGTRSGDVDPSLSAFLAEKAALTPQAVDRLLNTESGLLGVSGISRDMRKLLDVEQREPRARLAVDMFCHRVRKAIGAALATAGGAQAVLFTGGIGENAAPVRERICAGMAWCGIRIDPAANAATVGGKEGQIGAPAGALPVWVIPTDEEQMIAEDTAAIVLGGTSPNPA
jgi:acetate kinase